MTGGSSSLPKRSPSSFLVRSVGSLSGEVTTVGRIVGSGLKVVLSQEAKPSNRSTSSQVPTVSWTGGPKTIRTRTRKPS
jgi:hypothetical protein